jgi:geranylgeranyl diphosphate synthase type II
MQSFEQLATDFKARFEVPHFPKTPGTLYEPDDYFLKIGGKRIRPVMCLMGNELFDEINPDAYHVATAVELFHNFTLIHDDIMDAAPLRRNMQTLHTKYGTNTALLAGDVMLVKAYEYLNKINKEYLPKILALFNKTAKEVCEGQQLDMDFEKKENVALNEYIHMITLKISVLLAASLQMGSILVGASEGNRNHLYEFGKNLGIAFQLKDYYLDAFGEQHKVGKDIGGDIKQNKKTFLLIRALEIADSHQKKELQAQLKKDDVTKVETILKISRDCGVDKWAATLKKQYIEKAFEHLEAIAVVSVRKQPLAALADFLVQREY